MNERKLIQDTTAGSIVIVKLVGNLAVGLSRSRDLVSTAYVQLSARRCTCNSGLVTLQLRSGEHMLPRASGGRKVRPNVHAYRTIHQAYRQARGYERESSLAIGYVASCDCQCGSTLRRHMTPPDRHQSRVGHVKPQCQYNPFNTPVLLMQMMQRTGHRRTKRVPPHTQATMGSYYLRLCPLDPTDRFPPHAP